MREFRFYREAEPGLIVRKGPADCVSRAALEGLARTVPAHYRRLWSRGELRPLRAAHFDRVVSIGGGHPHFEAGGLDAGSIQVYDPLAAHYAETADVFRAAWPGLTAEVAWTACGHSLQTDLMTGADLVVFCHCLEHMSPAKASEYLRALPAGADLLIYGPNADTMHDDLWRHARPVHEHLWMPGLAWMRSWAEGLTGREAAVAIAHDLDLLVWLPAAGAAPVPELVPAPAAAAAAIPEDAQWGTPPPAVADSPVPSRRERE